MPTNGVLQAQSPPELNSRAMSELVRLGSMGSALWAWYSPGVPEEALPSSRPMPAAARERPGLTGSFMSMLQGEVRLLVRPPRWRSMGSVLQARLRPGLPSPGSMGSVECVGYSPEGSGMPTPCPGCALQGWGMAGAYADGFGGVSLAAASAGALILRRTHRTAPITAAAIASTMAAPMHAAMMYPAPTVH